MAHFARIKPIFTHTVLFDELEKYLLERGIATIFWYQDSERSLYLKSERLTGHMTWTERRWVSDGAAIPKNTEEMQRIIALFYDYGKTTIYVCQFDWGDMSHRVGNRLLNS